MDMHIEVILKNNNKIKYETVFDTQQGLLHPNGEHTMHVR